MCSVQSNANQRPLAQSDVLPVASYYNLPFAKIQNIYEAMTEWEVPEVAPFILIVDTLWRQQQKEYSINQHFGSWTPLSAISLDNEFTRYRTEEMQVFHDGYLAFNMSQRNREMVDASLKNDFGVRIVSSHSCGVAIVSQENYESFMDSELHKCRNFLRSRANSLGTPLVFVDSMNELPDDVDMGKSEKKAYLRMWDVLSSLKGDGDPTNAKAVKKAQEYLRTNLENTKISERESQSVYAN